MCYTSKSAAQKVSRKLTRETGQRHIVRPFALGNKIAYSVVNVERFA